LHKCLTWYHHITLLEKVKDEQERLWSIQQAIAQGWSRNILVMQIETHLYQRKGKALTNFQTTLPALQSDLAQAVLHDPYIFDFITISEETQERHIQQALLAHIQWFLLELGVGFAFVGNEYHLVVGEEDYYVDLLFYHIRLRCGIATYQFTTLLPDAFRDQLPAIEELEASLKDIADDEDQ
jgi:predicted nuclease of restriction endonuclease-like (RecB) superfamily